MKTSMNPNSYLGRASVLIAITLVCLFTVITNPARGHLSLAHLALLTAAGLCLWGAFALLLGHKE